MALELLHALALEIDDLMGPVRPETVEMRRVVEACAAMSRPAFEWPESWLVWLDMLDDGQRKPPTWLAEHATVEVPDWVARWWLAFREWTHAGKLPDSDALARDLHGLITEPERRLKVATGKRLDAIGAYLDLTRTYEEADDAYRTRINDRFAQTFNMTPDEMRRWADGTAPTDEVAGREHGDIIATTTFGVELKSLSDEQLREIATQGQR